MKSKKKTDAEFIEKIKTINIGSATVSYGGQTFEAQDIQISDAGTVHCPCGCVHKVKKLTAKVRVHGDGDKEQSFSA